MRSRLADLFYNNAEKAPDQVAIWCDGKIATYKEMAGYVSRYSNFLLKNNITYGDHIAIPMNNSMESIALIFAAADLGVCLVPLNPTLPIEAVKTAIKYGDVQHLIARNSFFTECEKNGGVHVEGVSICLDADYPGTVPFFDMENMPSTRPDNKNIIGNESLILTMTSGSTGNPKPIDLSQDNKYERAMAHIREYKITKNDRILAATPLYHSLAERLVILPLILGATSVLLPRFTPDLWLRCVKEQKVSFTIAVSVQLAQILEVLKEPDAPDIDSLRAVVSSSALLEEEVKLELINKLRCEFHEMYGTSETSTVSTICFQRESSKQKSVGKMFDTAKVRIFRDDDTDCKPNEIGEIAVKSPLMCKGYYKMEPFWTAAKHDGYFHTGDLGYMDEDGYLYFSGRLKEIIITGAVNVYPHDIDMVVGQIPEVEECAAFAYPDDRLGEVVALAVVPKEETDFKARTVRSFCAKNLADFQQPHKIFILDQLPKNTMGKLQRMGILDYIRKHGLDD